MASLTPNLSLISWTGSDPFDHADLATNWSILDSAFGDLLDKSGTDTISGDVTVTGTFRFGSSATIIMQQKTITDTVAYKGIEIAGTIYLEKGSASDTAFGVKLTADADADDSFRLKIRGDGRIYFGDGTAHDVVVMRDANDSLAVQLDADVDTANVTKILASPELGKDFTGYGLTKQNLVWNPDFEFGNAGWSVAGFSTITNAATSITAVAAAGTGSQGTQMGQIVTPGGSANQGAHFTIYHRFLAGTQYNIRVRIYSGTSTANVEAGIAGTGVIYAQSSPTALSTTWTELSFSWTPGSSVNEAVVFARVPGTTATTFSIDEVKVFVGSTPTLSTGFFPISTSMRRTELYEYDEAWTSNQQYAIAVNVEKGMKVSQIGILSGATPPVGLTGAAAGIYSAALGTSTAPGSRFDLTRLAFASNFEGFVYNGPHQPMVWTLATPYRFAYTGIAYIVVVFTATTTMPSWAGRDPGNSGMFSIRGYNTYPLVGELSTGTSLPGSASIGTTSIGIPYAWIG